MRILAFFLLTTLWACGSEPAREATAEPAAITQPAPGVRPQPAAGGNIDYAVFTLADLQRVDGCSILLSPDDDRDKFLFAMGYPTEPAEIKLDGKMHVLPFVGEREAGPETTTYIHANDRYEVTTTVTVEGRTGDEVFDVSGTVEVRDKGEDNRSLSLRVTGEQGC